MRMATANITVRTKPAWWLTPYLRTVALACWLLRTEPNMERVGYWIGKGIKLELC